MWLSDSNNLSPNERFVKPKVKKGKKHGDKTPTNTGAISSRLLHFLVRNPIRCNHPFGLVFKLYQHQFLNVSVTKELINPFHLAIAGDGTQLEQLLAYAENISVTAKKMVF